MIRHIVLVRFDAATPAEERVAIFAELAALRAVVPGLLHFAGGPDVGVEGLNKGYHQGFTVDFVDAAARDAYLVHPAHQAAGARLVGAAAGGTDGLVVLDFEMPG